MTLDDLLPVLTDSAPALKNHLWQSTLFALAVALLALLLRRNQARTRCWLWLAASLKFLLPFSLLVALGSHLAPLRPAPAQAGLYSAMKEVGQPFEQEAAPALLVESPVVSRRHLADFVPLLAIVAWMSGLLFLGVRLLLRWRQMMGLVLDAAPMQERRVVEALRRAKRRQGGSIRVEVLASSSVFGPESMASCDRSCCGRRVSPRGWTRPSLKLWLPMSFAMCLAATT